MSDRWKGLATAGAVVCAVPLAFHISIWKDGVYRDWVAIGCGAAGAVLGLATLFNLPANLIRKQAIAAGIGVVLLAGVQLARGFGVFEAGGGGGDAFQQTTTFVESPPVTPPPPPPVDPDDPARCADQHACFQLGRKLEQAKDLVRATVAYERSCDDGSPGGCFNAGFGWSHRDKPDAGKAAHWYQRGCDLEDADSCSEFGLELRRGDGVPKDLERARAMFAKACDGKSGLGCVNIESMQEAGELPKDDVKALALLTRACDVDDREELANACEIAGNRIEAGIGTKKDVKRALPYWQKACDRAAQHCFALASAYHDGTAVKRDYAKALALYGKACDADNAGACNNLGDMLRRGTGTKKNEATAKQLFEKACDGGDQMGCKNLGKK